MALVLSRRVGERVILDGGRIAVEVAKIGEDKVRLAFFADDSVQIDREEIFAAKLADERNGKSFGD